MRQLTGRAAAVGVLCALAGPFAAAVGTGDTPCEHGPPVVITNAALWTNAGVKANHEVAIAAGRVIAVGLSGQLVRPRGARVIDARGASLLPGLIDAHAHLFELSGPMPKEVLERPREHAFPVTTRQLLRSGVTSARVHLFDLEYGPALMRQAVDDCFPSPRLQIGGPGFIGGEPPDRGRQVWGAGDDADIRQKIAEIRNAGAQWVALHTLERFAPGQLATIFREARAAGLRVMTEGSSFEAATLAVNLGADSLDYIDQSTSERYPDELIAAMRARGDSLFVVPTPGNERRYEQWRRDESILYDSRARLFMPERVAAHVFEGLRERRLKPLDEDARRTLDALPSMPAKFRQLRDAGLNMGLGTDCGSTAQFHVDAIWRELQTWRSLGVTPHDALKAATTHNAALLRMPDSGALRVGSRADFVLYEGDILDGAFRPERVRTVAKGGVLFVDSGRWLSHGAPPVK